MATIQFALEDWRAGVGRSEYSRRGRRSAEAADWIFNPEHRARLTFDDACAILDLAPTWARKQIRAGGPVI